MLHSNLFTDNELEKWPSTLSFTINQLHLWPFILWHLPFISRSQSMTSIFFFLLFKIIVKIVLEICKKEGRRRNTDISTGMQTKSHTYLRFTENQKIYIIFFLIYKFLRSKYSPLVNTSDDNIILNPLICIILYSTNSRFAAVWSNMNVVLWNLIT